MSVGEDVMGAVERGGEVFGRARRLQRWGAVVL